MSPTTLTKMILVFNKLNREYVCIFEGMMERKSLEGVSMAIFKAFLRKVVIDKTFNIFFNISLLHDLNAKRTEFLNF